MNKAKTWGNAPTKEVQFYARAVEQVCNEAANSQKIEARYFKSYVRERVGIKRAIIGGGVPAEVVEDFKNLWRECVEYLQ